MKAASPVRFFCVCICAVVWDYPCLVRLWRTPIVSGGGTSQFSSCCSAPASAEAHATLLALRYLIWSRIRTVLARFTCTAMLRMQTLVCAPERYYKLRFSSQLLWGCIRCVRWHSASSAPSVALLRLQFCNSLEGPVHARRLRSHRRHGPSQVL